ncbi:MAG: class F sortase [Propionibacteriaceae bacterium]|jgi:LPXTG-site transpeptidase (sortase) family protein|nr:class F sortase [Propionibacteriaceae bacterium]
MVSKKTVKWAWRGLLGVLAVIIVTSVAWLLRPAQYGPDGQAEVAFTPPPIPSVAPSYEIPHPTVEPSEDLSGAASAGLHLTIPAIGVDADVYPYTPEVAAQGTWVDGTSCYSGGTIICVNPPSMSTVSQQIGGVAGVSFGDNPGLDSQGTVYFFGHAGARTGAAVFDYLSSLKPGDTAEVTTANGILTYVVDEVINMPKSDYATSAIASDQVPGRLLLISCDQNGPAYANGYATNNIIAVLHVESARELG